MFVMVQPIHRRLDQWTCESPLDNTLILLGGGELPLYIPLCVCVGGVCSEGLALAQPSQRCLDQVTMWGAYRTMTLTVLS